MKKILITGGAGFIGSNFIHYLLRNSDYHIVNFDALTYAGNLQNLEDLSGNERYTFLKGDIADKKDLQLLTGYDYKIIINFAAESHVDRSFHEPDRFFRTNVVGTLNLIELAQENPVDLFLQISTDEVYGSLEPPLRCTESSLLNPSSPYAASKAAADLLAIACRKSNDLPIIVSRCSNNYGPYQFPEKLIPLLIANALQDKPLPVYGDGRNIRDWIFVSDHCAGLLSILQQGRIGEIYNLGGDSEMANLEVVERILQILNKPRSLIRFVPDRKAHDRRYAVDFSKAEKELGWAPLFDFTRGIEMTVDWYLQNRPWLETILSGAYRQYYQRMYGL